MSLQNIFPPKRTFEHKGKVYNIKLLDESVRSQYEEVCYQSELAKLDKVAGLYTPADLAKRKKRLADMYLARKFRLDKGNLNLDQGLLLCSLILGCSQDEAIMLCCERPDDVKEMFRISQNHAFGEAEEGTGDGKKKA